ncbi:hypothetical protein MSG28_011876 [Choristoneura fumiferana]|uniref:Uncharacterized protein n=2 Tax=Choristoneura fumiferana TaxID=7141 RepID=A0ACC0KNJ1_CHOFU|nr:hypothetical protein MSG28_011876 [Choristoneura fumiferana]KAI8437614.1 hypothetical protein MSG28_011876 [Choristoneura fumiferana]
MWTKRVQLWRFMLCAAFAAALVAAARDSSEKHDSSEVSIDIDTKEADSAEDTGNTEDADRSNAENEQSEEAQADEPQDSKEEDKQDSNADSKETDDFEGDAATEEASTEQEAGEDADESDDKSEEAASSSEEQVKDDGGDDSHAQEDDEGSQEKAESEEKEESDDDKEQSKEDTTTEDKDESGNEEQSEEEPTAQDNETSEDSKEESDEEQAVEDTKEDDSDKSGEETNEVDKSGEEDTTEEEAVAEPVEKETAVESAADEDTQASVEGEQTSEEGEEASEDGEQASDNEKDDEETSETSEQTSQDEEGSPEAETVEKEEAAEEELLNVPEIPENLRSRDHISQILRLDEETSEAELTIEKSAEIVLRDIKKLYENSIKPLETLYKYRDLSNRHFGAEPSPAYFNILMHGKDPEVLDGTQLAADWTFSGLQKFGQGLEERLRGLRHPSKILEKVNIVEIPGILEVRKQVSRVFPFNDACQWFIDRADIIFLVYDPSKLDVGPETEAILDQLKGRESQTRIVLNKADSVKPEELMRVQSALIWNISPLMSSAQPPVMYTVSLWSMPFEAGAPVRLLQAQERELLRDLRQAIDKRIENKISSARRFAVRVRNHAKMVDCYLTTYYNHKTIFGNKKLIADAIIENPQNYHIYEGLSTLTNISRYDLPDPETYRDFFRLNPLYEFQQLAATCTYFRGCPINRLDVAIAYDLPEIVGKYKKMVETSTPQGMPKKRYFTKRYVLNVNGIENNDIMIMFHSNRITLLSLAPSHFFFKTEGDYKINFTVGNINRLSNTVKGKGKKGGQALHPKSIVCNVEFNNGTKFDVLSCMKGTLIEINEELVKNPELLKKNPDSDGFIAIILSSIAVSEANKNEMLSHEDYHLHKHNIPFGLATSSSKEGYEMKTSKNHLELFSLFPYKTFGSDPEVKKGKPAPDTFLVAATKFPDKPAPAQCLVFEDAVNDTEELYTVAFQNIVSKFGKNYTYELKVSLMGSQAHETADRIIKALDLPLSRDEFVDISKKEFADLFPTTEVLPGARRLIEHLHKHNIPIGLATSSSVESYELKTNHHQQLFSLFPFKTFGSDSEVRQGKPSPDIFFVAAGRFPDKPDPSKCLVFEDSVNGVKAAKAAGMQVVMVPDSRLDKSYTKEATLVLNSLEDFKPEVFSLPPYDD